MLQIPTLNSEATSTWYFLKNEEICAIQYTGSYTGLSYRNQSQILNSEHSVTEVKTPAVTQAQSSSHQTKKRRDKKRRNNHSDKLVGPDQILNRKKGPQASGTRHRYETAFWYG